MSDGLRDAGRTSHDKAEIVRHAFATPARGSLDPERMAATLLAALWPLRLAVLALAPLCWPASVAAQERSPILDRAIDSATSSAIVAHAADVSTTTMCLTGKTCVESNPFVLRFGSSPLPFFALKMGTAFGSYVVKTKTKRDHPKLTLAFAVAENVALFWIAKHNYDVHQRTRRR